MPYTVSLPDGRTVEFPDAVRPEQAAQIIRTQLLSGTGPSAAPVSGATPPALTQPTPQPRTISGEVLEVLKGIPSGAVGLLETAATGAAAILQTNGT